MKLKILFLFSIFLSIIIFLALPYPFNCFSDYDSVCCFCTCPWWIFILLQFFLSLLWYRHLNLKKEKDRFSRAVVFFLIGLFVLLSQVISTAYYQNLGSYEFSDLCSRFWLIDLLTLLFFIFLPI